MGRDRGCSVPWRPHQDRPSTGHALPRGHINKGGDWSPTPRPGTGRVRGPLSEPVHGNQGCLHPAGFSRVGAVSAPLPPASAAWPQGWRSGAEWVGGGGSPSLWTKAGSRSRGRGVQHLGQQEHQWKRHGEARVVAVLARLGRSRLQVGGAEIPPPTPSACQAVGRAAACPLIVYDAT